MNIRPARSQDSEAIAALSAQLGYPAAPAEVAAYQASLLQFPDHQVLVAEDQQGQVVGWVHVFIAHRLVVPPFAELGGIVVRDSQQRSGVGSALLSEAEAWALGAGCSLFRIRANTRRSGADAFYRRRGYGLSKTQNIYAKVLIEP